MRFLVVAVAGALLITLRNDGRRSMADGAQRTTTRNSYLGFDRNDYPGDGNLAALRKTFAFAGYWLNAPPGATQTNWLGKRPRLEEAGFGFAVLFNGREYRDLQRKNAAALGHSDGLAAVATARQEGFQPRAILFLDQEEGGRLLPEQKQYLYGWVDAVNSDRYRAGVYCSGIEFVEGGGAHVITANDIRDHAGERDITYWVSNDVCPPSPGCGFTNVPPPRASGVDFADIWQFAQSPRRPDQTAQCARTYAADGNCYPPGFAQDTGLHVDVSTATSDDPSHGRVSFRSRRTE